MADAAVYYRYDNAGQGVFRTEYVVQKKTPCGVRLDCGRFVNNSHRKRWAYPTDEEARSAFLARKRRQALILKAQLDDVNVIMSREDPFEKSEGCALALDDFL